MSLVVIDFSVLPAEAEKVVETKGRLVAGVLLWTVARLPAGCRRDAFDRLEQATVGTTFVRSQHHVEITQAEHNAWGLSYCLDPGGLRIETKLIEQSESLHFSFRQELLGPDDLRIRLLARIFEDFLVSGQIVRFSGTPSYKKVLEDLIQGYPLIATSAVVLQSSPEKEAEVALPVQVKSSQASSSGLNAGSHTNTGEKSPSQTKNRTLTRKVMQEEPRRNSARLESFRKSITQRGYDFPILCLMNRQEDGSYEDILEKWLGASHEAIAEYFKIIYEKHDSKLNQRVRRHSGDILLWPTNHLKHTDTKTKKQFKVICRSTPRKCVESLVKKFPCD